MSKKPSEVRLLKVGKYVIIDDEPCKILNISTSSPGKHGAAKARIDARGLFDEQKRTIIKPVNAKIDVPILDKRKGQVLSVSGSEVQLMDLETYETMDIPNPDNVEVVEGGETSYMIVLGRKKITGPR
ncbi:MAG: translation initiation factor IF-5A [Candidatus Pacebacteria bacterium]|nr:translation initiation factor IF-5A [Candidatus Paceibacterota bacterium]